ncbi:hypothetical protein FA95DRAFT_966606 [Auriscalpium vulgare]|uniref:Uncharacterized protein n=1 Tax=Auriscalpium vulgare TaxID=40419 RepID=A0ACB8R7P3_9AGAM|nr:hypothetical protein FA95DRAFT_966606 [Auriscalpium vulgare]
MLAYLDSTRTQPQAPRPVANAFPTTMPSCCQDSIYVSLLYFAVLTYVLTISYASCICHANLGGLYDYAPSEIQPTYSCATTVRLWPRIARRPRPLSSSLITSHQVLVTGGRYNVLRWYQRRSETSTRERREGVIFPDISGLSNPQSIDFYGVDSIVATWG